jgi:hypothetical protein
MLCLTDKSLEGVWGNGCLDPRVITEAITCDNIMTVEFVV